MTAARRGGGQVLIAALASLTANLGLSNGLVVAAPPAVGAHGAGGPPADAAVLVPLDLGR